jgi:hypothetical protein
MPFFLGYFYMVFRTVQYSTVYEAGYHRHRHKFVYDDITFSVNFGLVLNDRSVGHKMRLGFLRQAGGIYWLATQSWPAVLGPLHLRTNWADMYVIAGSCRFPSSEPSKRNVVPRNGETCLNFICIENSFICTAVSTILKCSNCRYKLLLFCSWERTKPALQTLISRKDESHALENGVWLNLFLDWHT